MARLDEYQGYIEDILSEYQQCTPAYGEAESDILYFQSELLAIALYLAIMNPILSDGILDEQTEKAGINMSKRDTFHYEAKNALQCLLMLFIPFFVNG